MLIDEQQAAELLGISVQEVEQLLADGVLLGRRTEEGWRISPKSVEDFRLRRESMGAPWAQHESVEDSRVRREQGEPEAPAKRTPPTNAAVKPAAVRLPFSPVVASFVGTVSWLGLAVGFALIGVAITRQTAIVAVFGGAVAFVSIAYIYIHDLMRAVLALQNGLQQVASTSADIAAAARRSSYVSPTPGRTRSPRSAS